MATLKENYCYVTYSDNSARFYSIGLMPYSLQDDDTVKSFAFSINFASKKGVSSLKEETDKKEYMSMKHFFGVEGDDKAPEGSLGGRGNSRLTNSDGDYFFGYIFSSRSGQKALEWFASRSSKMPSKEDVEVPEDIEDEDEKKTYIIRGSSHSLEELAELLDVKLKKKSSTSAPKIIKGVSIDAPIKNRSSPVKVPTLPIKTAQVAGVPTSRKAKETTNEDIQNAINLIFKAVIDGKITNESQFEYYWEDPSGATTQRDEDNSPEVYKGFVGTREATKTQVKSLLKNKPEDEYDTSEIEPVLIFRLMSHRKEANE